MVNAAIDDFLHAIELRIRCCSQANYRSGVANRRERVAQFMRERGQEFVLAPVDLAEFLFGLPEVGDIKVDPGPADHLTVRSTYWGATRKHWMVFAVDAAKPVFDVPVTADPHALPPGVESSRRIVRV